jgi:hypothetical protein
MSALLITGLRLFYKEYVLTPRGRDVNPEHGPVVAGSPVRKLSYLWVLRNVILILIIEGQTTGCCRRDPSDYNSGPIELPC